MAERRAQSSASGLPADAPSLATPEPTGRLHASFTELVEGTVLYRVHQSQYRADEFNPGVRGNARFSPIQDDHGQAIPVLYAGTTLPCALMETVFHDVPHSAGFKSFDRAKLAGQVRSTIRVEAGLQLVDLSSVALRKLGVTRKQLIDTEKDQSPPRANGPWRSMTSAPRRKACPGYQGRTIRRALWCCSATAFPGALFRLSMDRTA